MDAKLNCGIKCSHKIWNLLQLIKSLTASTGTYFSLNHSTSYLTISHVTSPVFIIKIEIEFYLYKKIGKQRAEMINSRFSVPCKVKVNIANKEGEWLQQRDNACKERYVSQDLLHEHQEHLHLFYKMKYSYSCIPTNEKGALVWPGYMCIYNVHLHLNATAFKNHTEIIQYSISF